jgi:hypothetical protein
MQADRLPRNHPFADRNPLFIEAQITEQPERALHS